MGKSPEQIKGLEAMASSVLVDELKYNGAGVYPANINSEGIDMGLQPVAPYYTTGNLSQTENLRAGQRQQSIAHDNDHANNSGNLTSRSHMHSQVLILDNRPQNWLWCELRNSSIDYTDSETWDGSRIWAGWIDNR